MANKQAAAQESAVKTMVVPVVVLVVICIVCSAILAALNSVTAPIIEENARLQTLESYVTALPEGTDAASLTEFEGLTTEGVTGAVSTPDGAIAVQAAASGYSGNAVTVYVAFDASGSISNVLVDASTQTAGIGTKTGEADFYGGFVGWDAAEHVSNGSPVDAIAGATVSSNAVYNAVNSAIDCYNNELKGAA
ncbi:MAG TPA: FMN-binding protein [Candidatus Gemmiger faecigallinarum]|nr:FMN-binding protein [Candidatus Gemmiger faecigallinarum]